ncbi:MAG TPA: tetratricopeptide repeat protein [Ferruginibacter sp.]|nr:tetratricopeptide repeat protein [Ferruginibacter sp.]HMP21424.1 tetratricopeptide repeat protein [Ferruginibacter sp.]
MSEEKQVVAEVPEVAAIVEKAKGFWAKFSKPIIYGGSAIILLSAGWIGYKNFVQKPNEEKAAEMIFPAQQLFDKMSTQLGFNKDSINLVLNGGGPVQNGVLKVISKYGSTQAGNTAHYIAGACYLYSKDFNNAIKHLKDFSTSATQVQAVAYSLLGDAYSELKNNDEAWSYYNKAYKTNPKDEFFTPEFLFKAALFAETIGKTSEAVEFLQRIKSEFPRSNHAYDVDKYLARLGVVE